MALAGATESFVNASFANVTALVNATSALPAANATCEELRSADLEAQRQRLLEAARLASEQCARERAVVSHPFSHPTARPQVGLDVLGRV